MMFMVVVLSIKGSGIKSRSARRNVLSGECK